MQQNQPFQRVTPQDAPRFELFPGSAKSNQMDARDEPSTWEKSTSAWIDVGRRSWNVAHLLPDLPHVNNVDINVNCLDGTAAATLQESLSKEKPIPAWSLIIRTYCAVGLMMIYSDGTGFSLSWQY
jgi:hypothetical protein